MNLIVALMVSKMDTAEAEVILAKQRIEEISSMADITNLVCGYFRKDRNSEYKNAFEKVCITARPKKERDVTFGKHRYSKWILKHHNEQDTNVRSILVMETFQSNYENFWD